MGHNYSKHSESSKKRGVRAETPVLDEAMIEATDVEEVDEMVEETIGVVANCLRLNVREKPSKEANIICVIQLGSEVKIDEIESTDEFYKVCTETGVEGFCMKQYITIL